MSLVKAIEKDIEQTELVILKYHKDVVYGLYLRLLHVKLNLSEMIYRRGWKSRKRKYEEFVEYLSTVGRISFKKKGGINS